MEVTRRNFTIPEVFARLRTVCARLGEFDAAKAEGCISAIEFKLADANEKLAEMTKDRDLWRDDHGDDCPYKDEIVEARRVAQWTPITPENLPSKGQIFLGINGDVAIVLFDWEHMYQVGWFIASPPAQDSEVKP
jgi:hypothetical protein